MTLKVVHLFQAFSNAMIFAYSRASRDKIPTDVTAGRRAVPLRQLSFLYFLRDLYRNRA